MRVTDGAEIVSEYPQHEKLKAVRELSQTIGEFLFEADHGLSLCRLVSYEDVDEPRWAPLSESEVQREMAAFFGIDLDELEREKRAMLEAIRAVKP